ncbi:MAG TPA: sulfate ABC transporter permease subunit CysT [Gammaproteobacteria bacterium]|nr:sulfate ABC transporter permease subunit CysT [Gammaproteobacteria bacterium]
MAAAKGWVRPSVLPGFGMTLGFAGMFLTAIVLIPIAALVIKGASLPLEEFWRVATEPRALASYRLTFGASLIAASLNAVFGFVVAWTLVRYDFPGRRIVDAIIDLPFALPTAVSGIALATVFAPSGWIGRWLEPLGIQVAYTWTGVVVALTLIGVPFVVRSVQPALEEVDVAIEEAAESLGASRWLVFRRVILPTVLPSLATGFTLALARAVGEYGSVIFIAGNLPLRTEITPLLIVIKLEQYDYVGAAALGLVMLGVSFVMLFTINAINAWRIRRVAGAR